MKIPYVIEPLGMNRPIDRSILAKKTWHRSFGRSFWKNAVRIIATSELEQEELVQDGVPQQKVVMRYNGIEAQDFPPGFKRGAFRTKWGIAHEETVILFMGRLIPRKGADVLIDAFAKACPRAGRLVITGPEGETGYRAKLEKCARESGVVSRVIFTGPLFGEEKYSALADADVFALPSRYENFANVAAEAIACGVPVIVTPFCGIRSLVAERAGLIASPERDSVAQALGQLVKDRSLYARLKNGCSEVAARLSWDHLAEQMEGYYQEVLLENGAAS
jgi:glycosyltransferase involved in cell wall biosynthesis